MLDRTRALLIGPSTYFNSRSGELGALSARYKLPAIYQERTFTAAGGVMSYGAPLADAYRGVGIYVGRVPTDHEAFLCVPKPCMGAAVDDNESPLGARERIDKSCVTPEKVKRVLT